jgi:uncharacterized protein YfaT (DUF1175 family)
MKRAALVAIAAMLVAAAGRVAAAPASPRSERSALDDSANDDSSPDRAASERSATAASATDAPRFATLSPEQSRVFRAWMVRIVDAQIALGPTPRWHHRDCAGLVRFAVAEAMRPHDLAWRRANAIDGRVPPDLTLSPDQQLLRHRWRLADGSTSAFVGALELIQENAVFVAKDINQAQPGDLLFFDQGDDQHLMVWTGQYIGYHTGTSSQSDNGLRAVAVRELMSWRDTRWQPVRGNPNFAGVYRLRFLSR